MVVWSEILLEGYVANHLTLVIFKVEEVLASECH